MRKAVRRLFSVRPQPRIVQVRVPSIIAGRRGLPVLLSAFAVLAAASTAATTTVSVNGAEAAPAGTTVLPPAAPPTYAYPGSSQAGTPGGATAPGGTGLNGGQSGGTASSQLAANGIPSRAIQAYQQAAVAAGCGIPWTLVAAIGRVESDHGRFSGATLLSDGRSDPPVVGIPLDGRPGVAVIKDTDGGKWDGDRTYDRAVGPMQFIPSSWSTFGVDGDGDGKTDPFDIDDAAASAAKYLCKAGGGNLSTEAAQRNAVYSYNRSTAYVDNVMALAAVYAGGAPVDGSPAPNGTPRPLPPLAPPTLPPGSIGDPPAAPGTTTPTRAPTTSKPATPTQTSHRTSPSSPAPTTTHPSSPAPTTTHPSNPAPTTTRPSSPAPTTTSPSPPSPTCTPSPSASPSSSGTNTPNGTASATGTATGTASAAATGTASAAATGTASADATGTPTPSPSPTLPPCPS
jgi:Transglycosylase SLT domain